MPDMAPSSSLNVRQSKPPQREAHRGVRRIDLQYYLEHMLDYDGYRRTLPEGVPARDEDRHLLTLRLTKLALQQNLELSFFAYWSPSDVDAYFRLAVGYKLTDAVLLTAGGNIFSGAEEHTFFGQFENNSNVYGGVRYSF